MIKKCLRGHPQTPDNLYARENGYRRCRACQRITGSAYAKRHPDRVSARVLKRYHKKKLWLDTYKTSCLQCGEKHPACLDFHHRNTEDKRFTIATAGSRAKADIEIELSKCDVLCRNCHSKLHYEEKSGNYARSR